MRAQAKILALAILFSLVAAVCGSCLVCAEEAPKTALRPYPTSPVITALALKPEKRAILEQLFVLEPPAPVLAQKNKELCPVNISRLDPVDDSAKKALATTEVTLAAELIFEHQGEKAGLELDDFSIIAELSVTRVFLQHRAPRFPSDSGGFHVPMASQNARPIRLEGKLGADMFALVPPLKECGVQAVALCPRRYTKNDELVVAPYTLKAIRPIINAKADGVYAPAAGKVGTVMTSLFATTSVVLPKPWFRTTSGAGTLSEAIQISNPLSASAVQTPLIVDIFPFQIAFESRVDFGRPGGSVRTASERVTLELSTINISDLHEVELGTSELTVQGGQCYLLSRWSEEVV